MGHQLSHRFCSFNRPFYRTSISDKKSIEQETIPEQQHSYRFGHTLQV